MMSSMSKKDKRRTTATMARKFGELGTKAQAKENAEKSLQKLSNNETKSNQAEETCKEIVQDAPSNVSADHIRSEKIMASNSLVSASNKSGPNQLPKPENLSRSQKKRNARARKRNALALSKITLDPEKLSGTMDDQTTARFSEIDNTCFEPRFNATFSNAALSLSGANAVSSETPESLSNEEIVCSTKLEAGQMQTDLVDSSESSNLTDFTECSKSEKEMNSVECNGIHNRTHSQKCSCCKPEVTEFTINDNEFDALQALQNPHGLQFGDTLIIQPHTDFVYCPDNAVDSNQVLSQGVNSPIGMCQEPYESESVSPADIQELKSVLNEMALLKDNNTVASNDKAKSTSKVAKSTSKAAKSTSKMPTSKLSESTRKTLQQKDISIFINRQKEKLPEYHTGTELSQAGFSKCQACSSEFHQDFITSDLSHTDSGVQSAISANPRVSSEASDSCLLPLQIFGDMPSVPSRTSDGQSWIPIQASDGPPPIPPPIPLPVSSTLLLAPLQASNSPSLIQLQTSSSASSVPLEALDIPLLFSLPPDILFSVPSDNPSSVPSQALDISSLILSQSPESSPFVSSLDSCSLSSGPLQAVDTTLLSSKGFAVSSFQPSYIIFVRSSPTKIFVLCPLPLQESSGGPLLFPSQALNIPLLYPQDSDASVSVSLQASDSPLQASFNSLSATSKVSDHSSLVLPHSSDTFPSVPLQGSCSPSLLPSDISGPSSLSSQSSGCSPVPSQSSCNSSLISSQASGSSSSVLSQASDIPPLYSQAIDGPLLVLLRVSDTGLQASSSPLSVSLQAPGTPLSVPLQASDNPLSVTPLASDSPFNASNTLLSITFQASDTPFQVSHTPLHASDTLLLVPLQTSCYLLLVPLQTSCYLLVPSQISCSRTSVSSWTSDTARHFPQARDCSSPVSCQFSGTSSSSASDDSDNSSLASSQNLGSLSSGVPQAPDTSSSSQASDSALSISLQFSGSTSVSLQVSVGFPFGIPIISRIVKWIMQKFWNERRKLLVVVLLILILKAAFRIYHIQQKGNLEFSYMQRCLSRYLSFIKFISVINKFRR